MTKALVDQPIRHCVEIRHASFVVPEFFALLRKYQVAFVFADSAGLWPYAEDISSDFLYIRLHGAEQLYASGYTPGALDWWADRIRTWLAGDLPADPKLTLAPRKSSRKLQDVYVYFDNDAKVHAPFDARALAERLGVALPPPAVETFIGRGRSRLVVEEPRVSAPAFPRRSSKHAAEKAAVENAASGSPSTRSRQRSTRSR